jgi:hypothetical protein
MIAITASGMLRSGGIAAKIYYPTAPRYLHRPERLQEISGADVFSDNDRLKQYDYVFEKRYRKVKEYPKGVGAGQSWIDVSYAVLKRKGKVLAKFDANIYFGLGNATRFGLFSFLNSPAKQIAVSQDISRGGTQWVISLLPQPRIIFDGPYWAVGREGDDMNVVDLDHDGVFEIVVPITDFYDFQDKLPIGRIPLPAIIFRYNKNKMKYFPANPLFESYAIQEINERAVGTISDEFDQRAMALRKLLAYIYVGKEHQAWELYNKSYQLGDKEALRRRVKAILVKQPVYKFIYNTRDHK